MVCCVGGFVTQRRNEFGEFSKPLCAKVGTIIGICPFSEYVGITASRGKRDFWGKGKKKRRVARGSTQPSHLNAQVL